MTLDDEGGEKVDGLLCGIVEGICVFIVYMKAHSCGIQGFMAIKHKMYSFLNGLGK